MPEIGLDRDPRLHSRVYRRITHGSHIFLFLKTWHILRVQGRVLCILSDDNNEPLAEYLYFELVSHKIETDTIKRPMLSHTTHTYN